MGLGKPSSSKRFHSRKEAVVQLHMSACVLYDDIDERRISFYCPMLTLPPVQCCHR